VRVLFNTYPVAFDCPGGGEVQLLKSKEALERAGVEVALFDPWRPQLDAADVVHYFSVQGGSMNFCSHVKRRGQPLVISPILWLTERERPRQPIAEIRDLLHLCDRVLPNSRLEQEQLAGFFGLHPGKFSISHNAVDAVFGRPADPAIFRDCYGIRQPFVLNVANIEPRKNQLRLIEALRGRDLELVILGRVRDPAYWAACVDLGADFVHYLGHVEHGSELQRSAYRACEVFALPSLLETPGLAALEAAAAGARVVLTRIGSAPEYFGDSAVYVDPQSVEDICRGIEQALQTPPNGLAQLAQTFTWDRTAQQLLAAYQAACA
jgi:glycosyltransferase involved in cell wall biosynthesis